jgi:hypothetical protein
MLDPIYELVRIGKSSNDPFVLAIALPISQRKNSNQGSDASNEAPKINGSALSRDIVRYNPLQSLNDPQIPSTFYETLSLISTFKPISCVNNIDPIKFVYLDLDETEGHSMAVQGRYPSALCYALSTKRWDFDHNGLNIRNFELESSNVLSLLSRCLHYNRRGINLSFGTQASSLEITQERLMACVNVLQEGGYLFFRITNLLTKYMPTIWSILLNKFDLLTLYKPATCMCIYDQCYIVGTGRNKNIDKWKFENINHNNDNYLGNVSERDEDSFNQQFNILRQYKHRAINGINAKENNTSLYDVDKAKVEYIGLY